jgi:hypothetical protein
MALPVLSSRIHQVPEMADVQVGSGAGSLDPRLALKESLDGTEWNWPDAETRLRDAFDSGGLTGWAQAALREVEDEAKAEKARREFTKKSASDV